MDVMNDMNEGCVSVVIECPWYYYPLWVVRPVLSINGEIEKSRWGTRVRKVPEGRYTVCVWFRWLWFRQAGYAELTVDVAASKVTSIHYRPVWAVPVALGKMQLAQPGIEGQ